MGIGLETLLKAVRAQAQQTGLFGEITVSKNCLICRALNSAEPAEYRICVEEKQLCVSLATANRWLSESIESDLVETGDDIADLIDEELRSISSYSGPALAVTHYRSADKYYTFRSPLPVPLDPTSDCKADPAHIEITYEVLITYQNVFSELGDMHVASS